MLHPESDAFSSFVFVTLKETSKDVVSRITMKYVVSGKRMLPAGAVNVFGTASLMLEGSANENSLALGASLPEASYESHSSTANASSAKDVAAKFMLIVTSDSSYPFGLSPVTKPCALPPTMPFEPVTVSPWFVTRGSGIGSVRGLPYTAIFTVLSCSFQVVPLEERCDSSRTKNSECPSWGCTTSF